MVTSARDVPFVYQQQLRWLYHEVTFVFLEAGAVTIRGDVNMEHVHICV